MKNLERLKVLPNSLDSEQLRGITNYAETSTTATQYSTGSSEDPHQWLEDIESDKALDWVKARNQETRNKLKKNAGFQKLRKDLQIISDAKDRFPSIQKIGDYYYNFWVDIDHPRGIWRRTSLSEYRKPKPHWETIFDLDALSQAENTNWVFNGVICCKDDVDRCLIQLSHGSADATDIRKFNLKSRSFIKNGFTLSEARQWVSWRNKGSIFVATDFGKGTMTDSGYPRIVKEWKRGTPLFAATTIYEGQQTDLAVGAGICAHGGRRYELVSRQITLYTSEQFVRENGELIKLDVPSHSGVSFFSNQILITTREHWMIGDRTYAAGSLLAIDFNAFKEGDRQFFILFAPGDNSALIGEVATKNTLLVQSLEHGKSKLQEWWLTQGKWFSRGVELPTFGAIFISPIDADHSDDYFFSFSDFLTPKILMLRHAGADHREELKSTPNCFDPSPFETTQNFATAKDGTKIPYFMVSRKDLKTDGRNPTLLYGDGGFQVSLTPTYSGSVGKAWLEKGGVYVVANIRGGGEYGSRRRQATLKENRQRAYDDFAAIAEDLFARNITRPRHLGAMGSTNSGLLAWVALTQFPTLFNAVVSQVPLLDMQAYNQLLPGASWMAEYGNSDVPSEWAHTSPFAPYQNVQANVKYPAVLFLTSMLDNRVHLGHARKIVARMLEQGHTNVWYYENIDVGRRGAATNAQRADMGSIIFSFLWNTLNRNND